MEKEQKLGEVLKGMVDTMKWKDKLAETKMRQLWVDKMGTTINHHTKDIKFRHQKLFLTIESSSLKQELNYEREKIRTMMNRALGGEYVKSVIVR